MTKEQIIKEIISIADQFDTCCPCCGEDDICDEDCALSIYSPEEYEIMIFNRKLSMHVLKLREMVEKL